jgi:nucleoside-diphosphate-sugar epimerase
MILVTGSGGFVGRQVLRQLRQEGHPLRLVLRPGSAAAIRQERRSEIVECPDLFEVGAAWWSSTLAGVDTVIHLAWYTEPGEYLQSQRNLTCMAGTIELARACKAAGVRRFVGVGTCAEYDQRLGELRADTPLKPETLYAACKAAVFHVLGQLLPAAGVEFAWCRLFYLYGEGEDSRRLVPYLHRQLGAAKPADLTSGNQIRDFLDVREAGALIARAALGDVQGAVNICSGIPVTVRQLAEKIADDYGRRDLLRFGARPDNLFDPPCVVGVPAALETP